MRNFSFQKSVGTDKNTGGFAYIGLLILVAIMGTSLAGAGVLFHQQMRREKEKQLLFVGDQYRRAIGLYYTQTPGNVRQYPKSLDDLLGDNRYLVPRRYLRRRYRDPITNSEVWGLVRTTDGGITGVYSRSEIEPIKRVNFAARDESFVDAKSYRDWQFVYSPAEDASSSKPN